MAIKARKLPKNTAGEFYVDSSCINCDTCRQIAADVFGESEGFSYVHKQPATCESLRRALQALVACPTASIGNENKASVRDAAGDFPLLLDRIQDSDASGTEVYYCGFNSSKSFGGNSYFLRHRLGNWLIDSPRWSGRLAASLEQLGGVAYIFLTHRDDVADAAQYAARFGSRRIIHKAELTAQPEAEIVLDSWEPVELSSDLLAIPTPGHTRGHCALLYRSNLLFSGDHLWWSREQLRLHASRSVCWYSWEEQRRSVRRLVDYSFEWVLPGHGQRVKLERHRMREHLARLASRLDGSG